MLLMNSMLCVFFIVSMTYFILKFKFLLSTLIIIELMAVITFSLISGSSMDLSSEASISFLYLAIAVCEGALGLSILVLLVRNKGNDYLKIN